MKEQTLLSLDGGIKKEAKKRNFNFSEVLEEALKIKLGYIEIKSEELCKKCLRKKTLR